MTTKETNEDFLFRVETSDFVAVDPEVAYAVFSDLPRSHQWSEECTGGEWVSGDPATVGAVFRGHNYRREDVVSWAPVVRGRWSTEAEVVEARSGRMFAWAMRDSLGRRQDSVWEFSVDPVEGGSVLTHRFRMGRPTEGIGKITSEMDAEERRRFFVEWGEKLESDMAATVARLKDVIENGN
ncbi:SRPBCC family protein [Actinopolyspora mortivallis]|uniref:SRPBCC family protein n=1 Tax=Actinopolyspora mortivallis TaxID=33906 RepID=UPI000378A978|nr:SRPBCC family protein [Actinopolyspora mortivallis]